MRRLAIAVLVLFAIAAVGLAVYATALSARTPEVEVQGQIERVANHIEYGSKFTMLGREEVFWTDKNDPVKDANELLRDGDLVKFRVSKGDSKVSWGSLVRVRTH